MYSTHTCGTSTFYNCLIIGYESSELRQTFRSSEMPNEKAPMKSSFLRRSQSQSSMSRRLWASSGLSVLHVQNHGHRSSFSSSSCSFRSRSTHNQQQAEEVEEERTTYNSKLSFQDGLRLCFTIFVRRALFSLGSFAAVGCSMSFTYGSANPFVSDGAKLWASTTAQRTPYRAYQQQYIEYE